MLRYLSSTKIVLAVCLLPFLCVACSSQEISRGENREHSSNISVELVEDNDILSMIERQSALCPYVRLCTHTNRSTSTFIVNKMGEFPCCSDCSCQPSCIAQGSCCPDFVYGRNETEIVSTRQDEAEIITGEMSCVRTSHGIFNTNNDGFKMIASCPGNFTYISIKERCEIALHIQDTKTLVDVTPVFHIESAISYRNIFCFLCNKAEEENTNDVNAQTTTFWNSRIYCSKSAPPVIFTTLDPLKFGKYLVELGCSIVFYNSVDTEGSSKPCSFDDVIKTCKSEYAATKLEILCKLYRWPITGKPQGVSYRTEKYRNYACFLCNDRTFAESCVHLTPKSSLLTMFMTTTDFRFVANLVKNRTTENRTDMMYIHQRINRYFPDRNGKMPCEKGFILDEDTNDCRQVLCPDNFFLKNGTCFPMIEKTEGISYYHLFEVIVPGSPIVNETGAFEDAVFDATKRLLNKRIGDSKYNLTLWRNAHVQTKINKKYFVVVSISDKFAAGNYLQLLTFFYKLGTSVLQLDVGQRSSKNIFEVEYRLTLDFVLQFNRFVGVSGEVLQPIRPNSFSLKRNMLQVTKSLLCYRVSLSTSEADATKSRVSILVKSTNKIIPFPNFQKLQIEFGYRILVCLDYALNNIASANKYIFGEYQSKVKSPQMVLNNGESRPNDNEYANDIDTEKDADLLERSIVTTVVTLVVLFIVVGSRMLLKRLIKR